jgi:hypothetical protein
MQAKLKLTLALCTLFTMLCGLAQAIPQATEAGVCYLLVRSADRPEKNYYELTRSARFMEPRFFSEEMLRQYKPSPLNHGADHYGRQCPVRCVSGMESIWIIVTSDSQKTPTPARDAAYFLSWQPGLEIRCEEIQGGAHHKRRAQDCLHGLSGWA